MTNGEGGGHILFNPADRVFGSTVVGIVTVVVGYVLTFFLKADQVKAITGESVPTGIGVGWLFSAMHNVPIQARTTKTYGTGPSMETVAITSLPIWESWLLLVPPALLIAAGYYVSTHFYGPTNPVKEGGKIALGYAALLFLASAAFVVPDTNGSIHATTTVRPAYFESALFGLVYPMVFGGIGVHLGNRDDAD